MPADITRPLLKQNIRMGEASGWVNSSRSAVALSRNDGTRTFTMTAVMDIDVYIYGVPRTIAFGTPRTVTWTDTEGTWYFYLDSNGILRATQSGTTWVDVLLGAGALVATLYWDASNKVSFMFCDERHGFMQGDIHLEMHNAFGTQWISGGALTNIVTNGTGGLATDAQIGVGDVTIYDEDLRFTFTNNNPQTLTAPAWLPVYYRFGATGVWRKKTSDVYPFIYSGTAGYVGANGRVPYNQWTGSVWQLTQLGDQNYVLIHIYATNDIQEPIIAVQGQNQYTSITAAQSGATTELLNISAIVKTLSVEVTPLGSVVLQTRTSYTNVPKARWQPATVAGAAYVDFRGNTFRGGVSSGVTAHNQLTGLPGDDHSGYPWMAGRTGGQTLFGGTATDEDLSLWANSADGASGPGNIVANNPIVLSKTDPAAALLGVVEGKFFYDSTDKTPACQLTGGQTTLQIGQEMHVRAVNKTGADIADGKVVYLSGAQGNRPTITLAINSSDAASHTLGVTTELIANNAEGYVTVFGAVRGFNTAGFTAGDRLYLSGTAGELTKTKPTGTASVVEVATALNSTANGSIFVKVDGPSHLADLHDVNDGAPANGKILVGDGTSWTARDYLTTPTAIAGGIVGTAGFIRTTDNDWICVTKNGATEYGWLGTDTAANGGGPILGAPVLFRTKLIASNLIDLEVYGSTIYQFTGTGFNLYSKRLQGVPTPAATDDGVPRIYVDQQVVVSPSQLTADQNNYNPTGFDGAFVLRLDSDANRTITGFTYTSGNYPVLRKQITNIGAYTITLAHSSTSSSTANRIVTPTGAAYPIASGASIDLWYDATISRWRIIDTPAATVASDSALSAVWNAVHMHCDALTTDVGGLGVAVTQVGSPTLDTSTPKFGTGCVNIGNNAANYLVATLPDDYPDLTYDDFTMSCWAYKLGSPVNGVHQCLLILQDGTSNDCTGPIIVEVNGNLNALIPEYNGGTWTTTIATGVALRTTTWDHLALVRYRGRYTFYVNGTGYGNTNVATPMCHGKRLLIGTHLPVSGSFNGKIDEVILRREALHKANFSVPTSPYADMTSVATPTGLGEVRIDGNLAPYMCVDVASKLWVPIKSFKR